MADNRLYTIWGENLDKNNVLQEYPRPQFERNSYINLNGEWDYAILPKGEQLTDYCGKILVPFSPESILSGVERVLKPDEVLYYRVFFTIPECEKKGRVLLNFGAVDYKAVVKVNDREVGTHVGGYLPFTFDITDAVCEGENELKVEVIDPTDEGGQARGKQKLDNSGIWYTPTSGIWQTVWIECVPDIYVESVRITPNLASGEVKFELQTNGGLMGHVAVLDKGVIIAEGDIQKELTLKLKSFEAWCPENPKLYDVEITYGEDRVESYFGMRSFGVGKDAMGVPRLLLNGKPYFHNGLLDQGYWSDGLYTPPSDEAMIFDISEMKRLGFNMLRKHIKIEPMRWYYHCDRLGMLVWQDMVSGGDSKPKARVVGAYPFFGMALNNRKIGNLSDGKKNYKLFSRCSDETREEYYRDLDGMLRLLVNVTSLALWVPFNEGWGQFDSLEAARRIREYDPSRLIDHASGWHDQGGPDVRSFHIYFSAFNYPKYDDKDERPVALTEFGGYSYVEEEHVHNPRTIFGYRFYKTRESLTKAYKRLFDKHIIPSIKTELSATVYTQVSDVQDEVNGIYTFDRRVLKVDEKVLKELNSQMKY